MSNTDAKANRRVRGAGTVNHLGADRWRLRFQVSGTRHSKVVRVSSKRAAERQLAEFITDLRRDEWDPAPQAPAQRPEMPTLGEFVEGVWWPQSTVGLAPRTIADYRWRLNKYLFPALGNTPLDEIDARTLDMLRTKTMGAKIGPGSWNKLVRILALILDLALEYEIIDRNVARAKGRRAKAIAPARTYLDSAPAIAALLDAAGELDQQSTPARQPGIRRALLSTLTFGGLRIGEALDLEWRDVNLADGRLAVRGTKTAAATRTVSMLPILRDDLSAWRARSPQAGGNVRVFGTQTGELQNRQNVRQRILIPSANMATARLQRDGRGELPALTPHSLRRTAASLWIALGIDPAQVMRQLGHTSADLTMTLYAKAMDTSESDRAGLRTLVGLDDTSAEVVTKWSQTAEQALG